MFIVNFSSTRISADELEYNVIPNVPLDVKPYIPNLSHYQRTIDTYKKKTINNIMSNVRNILKNV